MKPITPIIIGIVLVVGILVSSICITSEIEKLPRSFKGYELYSWEKEGQWHFTLITGTNRIKTIEEITSKGDFISETGWVKIQVVGADAIRAVLSKLPQGEEIVWLDSTRSEQAPPGNIEFMFPPEQIIDSVKEHAEECGLNLQVLALS
jgi:hypothetical protein